MSQKIDLEGQRSIKELSSGFRSVIKRLLMAGTNSKKLCLLKFKCVALNKEKAVPWPLLLSASAWSTTALF